MSVEKEELHRRIMLVRDKLEAGKIKFAPHLVDNFWESFSKLRYGSDGLIDPDSVDSRVRSMASMVSYFDGREKAKESISLREIQFAYFELIDANFLSFYKLMEEKNLTPYQVAERYSADADRAKDLAESIPDFLSALAEFWEKTVEFATVHLEDMSGFKAAFGGDLFPSYQQNIASAIGLYVDTIILPDPFLRAGPLFKMWSAKDQSFYILKLALNLLSYRPLALAQLDKPIVAILPDKFGTTAEHQEFIRDVGMLDAVKHCGRIFGRQFESIDEVRYFAKDLRSAEDLVKRMVSPDRLLFNSEWRGPKISQIHEAYTKHYKDILPDFHAGEFAILNSISRLSQANDVLIKARELRGSPILDAPTSWQYLTWKYEYDALAGSPQDLKDTFMAKGLQDASAGQMKWLGKIPPKTLVELRRNGDAEEIRNLISNGIKEIESLEPADFVRAGDLVVNGIRAAFSDHDRKIEDLKKSRSDLFKDSAMWVAVGALEIAAIAKGIPSYGLMAFAADQLFDVPKLKELPAKMDELKKQKKETFSAPAAILASIKKGIEIKDN